MTSNKKLRARGRKDRPGSGPNADPKTKKGVPNPAHPKTAKHGVPPAPLMELVVSFLAQYGYGRAAVAIRVDTQKREAVGGVTKPVSWKGASRGRPSLDQIFLQWQEAHEPDRIQKPEGKPEDDAKTRKGPSNVMSSSGEEEKSDEETRTPPSSGSPNSATSPESSAKPTPSTSSFEGSPKEPSRSAKNQLKRKSPASETNSSDSESSSSSSDSSSESDSGSSSDSHTDKKARTSSTSSSSASASTESSSSSSSSASSSSSSASESSSSSEEEASGGESDTSSTSSSSSSESDDSSSSSDPSISSEKKRQKKRRKVQSITKVDPNARTSSTDSSATLAHPSPIRVVNGNHVTNTPAANGTTTKHKRKRSATPIITPTMTTKTATGEPAEAPEGVDGAPASGKDKRQKKENIPFSRIPTDQQVNPRFASNAYVPYDYAERAHRDLVVTKGKNFTKEKNKKKRGAYKGGYIDTVGVKGIKFDD